MRGLILLIAFIALGIAIFLLNKYTRPKKEKKQEEAAPAAQAEEATQTQTQAQTETQPKEEEYERKGKENCFSSTCIFNVNWMYSLLSNRQCFGK